MVLERPGNVLGGSAYWHNGTAQRERNDVQRLDVERICRGNDHRPGAAVQRYHFVVAAYREGSEISPIGIELVLLQIDARDAELLREHDLQRVAVDHLQLYQYFAQRLLPGVVLREGSPLQI